VLLELCAFIRTLCILSTYRRAAEAQGLRQHLELQRGRELAPLRVGRPDRRAVGLGGGAANLLFPHGPQQ
jgi:hypothetical protein